MTAQAQMYTVNGARLLSHATSATIRALEMADSGEAVSVVVAGLAVAATIAGLVLLKRSVELQPLNTQN